MKIIDKRKTQKKNKNGKEQGIKAIVKEWEVSDFVVRLS